MVLERIVTFIRGQSKEKALASILPVGGSSKKKKSLPFILGALGGLDTVQLFQGMLPTTVAAAAAASITWTPPRPVWSWPIWQAGWPGTPG